jgi:hypothetical protein
MSMQQLERLPGQMMLFDNQQGEMSDSGGPVCLDIRDTVALLQPKPGHHRSVAEALRIAAKADAEVKGQELAIEHVIRSSDKVSKIHEKEQKLIQKLTRSVNAGL